MQSTIIAPATLSGSDDFGTLETTVVATNNLSSELLNRYIDSGLELAISAGDSGLTRLQESWLRRLYTTLRDTGLDPSRSEYCRRLCFDGLYQVFFALRHLYKARPGGEGTLRTLTREMQFISRHLV